MSETSGNTRLGHRVSTPATESVHVSVLLRETIDPVLEALAKGGGESGPRWVVDCTLGGGGHAGELLAEIAKHPDWGDVRVLAIDQDTGAVERAHTRFASELAANKIEIHHSRISELGPLLEGRQVFGIIADLGFSSDQLETADRGLSFMREGPLDMRMDTSRGETCRELLARLSEREIADVIYQFGEERLSRRIARRIVDARSRGELPHTTAELASLVVSALPPKARHGRIHGATRTFQALRIAVNDELDELDALLSHVILALGKGGRASVISFHSLEDRRVKLAFRQLAAEGGFRLLTRKPITASESEIAANSRARSAKLRVIERI